MPLKTSKQKRKVTVTPKQSRAIKQFGENIKLAIKRRGLSVTLIAERTGLSERTVGKITSGDPAVGFGYYVVVLSAIGMLDEIAKLASDDELGRRLQDIELLKGKK